MQHQFIKMNGAGNDFVIFCEAISLTPEQIRSIASRDNPITKGCDQLIVLRPSDKADVFMSIYNADGSEVDACGNATRCVATLLEKELGRLPVTIETNVALLTGIKKENHNNREYILVDMGVPRFNWQAIPLSLPLEEAKIKVKSFSGLEVEPHFVNMGNPHIVFFLHDEAAILNVASRKILEIGPRIESYREVFPQGVNVSLARVASLEKGYAIIHSNVWERGAGNTKACGTAACAMFAAANKISSSILNAAIWFENSLQMVSVGMNENKHILLGGPVETEFKGQLEIH